MAITRLFRCVLIQVLLIKVYGEIEINCRNQTGTVGKPLHLTCNVTCTEASLTDNCSWTLNNSEKKFYCSEENMADKNMDAKVHKFNWTIQNASKNHSGKWTFGVQMNTGFKKTIFNVNIVDPPTIDSATNVTSEKMGSEEENKEYRSNTIAALLGIVFVLAIIIMLALYRKRKNIHMSVTEQCDCQNITAQDIKQQINLI
ncbi:uncharacterized protein LOC132862890 isoform X1 [Tachysurus vachellii]|uniref:uncharacterized protein LOC132862890 isoform X1 n=1 Tax=Tachysurus vachellii TaxID=175792 RepID=UPI00296B12AE|nr:uncharacterized protein LOC132862890 isoform X1 [Tachysurus vachellii]XP_060751216.1 uncharacterized protein LOC132862890 isoform X1 [Tachysurus vachellii]